MNRDDLLVRVDTTLSGWLRSRSESTHPETWSAHHQLLRAAASRSRGAPSAAKSRIVVRASMLFEVSRIARRLVDRACTELRTLKHDGCTYAYEFTTGDPTSYTTMAFDDVPWPGSALTVMLMAVSLRSLPAEQQQLVPAIFLAQDDLTLSEMHEHWAREDGHPDDATRHAQDATVYRKKVSALRDRLSAETAEWFQTNPDPFPPGWWEEYPIPVDVPVSAAGSELDKVAGWYREFGLRLFQPMELDGRAPPQRVAMWKRHWKRAEDCGDGFILLSSWLRCLAQTEDSKRCGVCYRHLDEAAGMRKFCSNHARSATSQKDPREMGVSRLYQLILRRRLRKGRDLESLLSTDDWPKGDLKLMQMHAQAERLPERLVAPAAALALFLRALIPLLSEPLAGALKEHFADVLRIACIPFLGPSTRSFDQATIESRLDQRRAEDWLGWEAFFRTWFGQDSEKHFKPAARLGRGLDVHHPLLKGPGVRMNKIAHDLVRYRIWATIDEMFDREAYSNPAEVVRLRDGGVPGYPGLGPLSFRDIGHMTGMSKEAAHKAYVWAKDPNSPVRRNRIVPERLRRLEKRLICELL